MAPSAPAWRDDFDARAFLARSWQRRPRLIRQAFPGWRNPLTGDELVGLACSAASESRIVRLARGRWHLEHGPFDAARFAALPRRDWTLLVQAVDHLVPDVAALLTWFRFLPDWRLDDVMVSYAVDGGGVGPHFDRYDVFLVQGAGRRRWRVGRRCDSASPLLPHDDLRLLAEFSPTAEWVLEPGDVLYLPPGFAHDGVALGDDCMTYSVGLRAPSRAELVSHWCDDVLERLDDDDRYRDGELDGAGLPGTIPAATLDTLHRMALEALGDRDAFGRWFARHVSLPKYPDGVVAPARSLSIAALRQRLGRDARLVRNPASRYVFAEQGRGRGRLCVDGVEFVCAGAAAVLARRLCEDGPRTVDGAAVSAEHTARLAVALHAQGSLVFTDDD